MRAAAIAAVMLGVAGCAKPSTPQYIPTAQEAAERAYTACMVGGAQGAARETSQPGEAVLPKLRAACTGQLDALIQTVGDDAAKTVTARVDDGAARQVDAIHKSLGPDPIQAKSDALAMTYIQCAMTEGRRLARLTREPASEVAQAAATLCGQQFDAFAEFAGIEFATRYRRVFIPKLQADVVSSRAVTH